MAFNCDANSRKLAPFTSTPCRAAHANAATMLTGVFHLHEQEAREVMTPIPAVVTVDSSSTVENALQRCVSSGHTRLVVIEGDGRVPFGEALADAARRAEPALPSATVERVRNKAFAAPTLVASNSSSSFPTPWT